MTGAKGQDRGDLVVRHRLGPLLAWAISVGFLAFFAMVTVNLATGDPAGREMTATDWLLMAVIWAFGGVFAYLLVRAAMVRLTLGADGSVQLVTRTPFVRREARLGPGSVTRIEVRRNPYGLIRGWQVILVRRAGGRLVVSERIDPAAQHALAQELARRLGTEVVA